MRGSLAISAVVGLAIAAASCDRANPAGPSTLTSTSALVSALRDQGAVASLGETIPNALPCVSVSARVVRVNSGSANVFEYASAAAADRDAAKISTDGSSVSGDGCASQVSWIGPPHFYKRDRLMVVYAGIAADVLGPLETVLGKPFAGR